MRSSLVAICLSALLLSQVSAFELTTAEFKGELERVFGSIFANNSINLAPDKCDNFYCGYELGAKIVLRAYSLTRDGDITELSAVSYANPPTESERDQLAFAGACATILHIVVPEINEQETAEILQQWIAHDRGEAELEVEGFDLIGETLPDQRICSIYVD